MKLLLKKVLSGALILNTLVSTAPVLANQDLYLQAERLTVNAFTQVPSRFFPKKLRATANYFKRKYDKNLDFKSRCTSNVYLGDEQSVSINTMPAPVQAMAKTIQERDFSAFMPSSKNLIKGNIEIPIAAECVPYLNTALHDLNFGTCKNKPEWTRLLPYAGHWYHQRNKHAKKGFFSSLSAHVLSADKKRTLYDKVIQKLVGLGFKFELQYDSKGNTLWHYMANWPLLLEAAHKNNIDINPKNNKNITPAIKAAKRGIDCLDTYKVYAQAGANLEAAYAKARNDKVKNSIKKAIDSSKESLN